VSSTAGNPTSPPASDPAQGQGGQGGEAGRIKSLDDRFTAIETEQKEQRGILGRIEQALTGGGPPKGTTGGSASPSSSAGGSSSSEPGSAGLSIAEQVRRGVEEIEAKRRADAEAQAARDAESAWRKDVEDRLPERRPAEPAPGRKSRLQRILVGKPDQR
jgi:hypothetical protein